MSKSNRRSQELRQQQSSAILNPDADDPILRPYAPSTGGRRPPPTKDKFIILKVEIFQQLSDCKKLVQERIEVLKTRGNGTQAIRLASTIKQHLVELKGKAQGLEMLLEKQIKSAKLTNDELNARKKDVQLLRTHINSTEMSFKKSVALIGDDGVRDKVFRTEAWTEPGRTGDMTMEEKDTLSRWNEQDKVIDQRIDAVGDVVDRLNPLAEAIGEQAEKQNAKSAGIAGKAAKNADEIEALNDRMERVRKLKKKGIWACRGFTCLFIFIFMALAAMFMKRILNQNISI